METRIVEEGGKKLLVVKIELQTPVRSKGGTGPNLVIASSGGFSQTSAQLDGKPVKVNLTAIVKP